ncbi:MAG: hypothetical protein KC620_17015, partial [Myxococcales bacterium]|nr:hypothetical protein [Myxococcales bacterium]
MAHPPAPPEVGPALDAALLADLRRPLDLVRPGNAPWMTQILERGTAVDRLLPLLGEWMGRWGETLRYDQSDVPLVHARWVTPAAEAGVGAGEAIVKNVTIEGAPSAAESPSPALVHADVRVSDTRTEQVPRGRETVLPAASTPLVTARVVRPDADAPPAGVGGQAQVPRGDVRVSPTRTSTPEASPLSVAARHDAAPDEARVQPVAAGTERRAVKAPTVRETPVPQGDVRVSDTPAVVAEPARETAPATQEPALSHASVAGVHGPVGDQPGAARAGDAASPTPVPQGHVRVSPTRTSPGDVARETAEQSPPRPMVSVARPAGDVAAVPLVHPAPADDVRVSPTRTDRAGDGAQPASPVREEGHVRVSPTQTSAGNDGIIAATSASKGT